jgi:hypothetical protein
MTDHWLYGTPAITPTDMLAQAVTPTDTLAQAVTPTDTLAQAKLGTWLQQPQCHAEGSMYCEGKRDKLTLRMHSGR